MTPTGHGGIQKVSGRGSPHTYRDLYLPIDDGERRLYDAIDGERTIGEIARRERFEQAGAFFERLYHHDQVVFDLSASAARSPRAG